jgi:hypothetical protein
MRSQADTPAPHTAGQRTPHALQKPAPLSRRDGDNGAKSFSLTTDLKPQ